MVKKTHIIPPVYPFAVTALAVLYAGAFFLRAPPVWRCCAGISVIVLCGMSAVAPLTRGSSRLPFWVVCGLLAGSLCALRVSDERLPLLTLARGRDIDAVTVELLGDPSPWGKGRYRAPARVLSVSTRCGAVFSASGQTAVFLPSAFVRSAVPGGIGGAREPCAAGRILSLSGAFMPYDNSTGEAFNAAGEARDQPLNAWISPVHALRSRLRVSLARVLYDWGDSGGFLLALLAGNRDYLDQSLADDFRRTGLSHVLALSGMHLSLMGLLAVRVGRRIGGRRVSVRLSLVAVLFFVWFAGGSPSLNRSLIMALLAMLFSRLGYARSMLPVLAATAAIQTLASPADALSLAFMLSYAALWGILTFGTALSYILEGKIPGAVRENLCSSVGAQILTTPVCAFATGIIAPVGVLASCVVSPLSSLFLVCGMLLTLPAALCPVLSHACGSLVSLMYRVTIAPVSLFARTPPLALRDLPQTMAASIMAGMVGVFVLLAATASRSRRDPDDSFTRL